MRLDKAIEILNDWVDRETIVDADTFMTAQKLGIEALKRVQHVRETYQKTSYVLLPGETED